MKHFLLAMAAFVGITSFPVHAQVKDLDDGVYKAAKLGMLSQRIGKAYLAQALKVDEVQSRKVLNDSIGQFDRLLVELKVYAPTPEIKSVYDQLEARWRPFKDTVVGKAANATTAAAVMQSEVGLLELSARGSKALQSRSSKASTKLVEIAENDAMLSQRVALYYYSALLNVNAAAANREVDRASKEFIANLQMLKTSKTTPAAMQPKLTVAASQWGFLENSSKNVGDVRNRAALVGNMFKASERLLEVLDDIAVSYENI
jgi:hypothetical protein